MRILTLRQGGPEWHEHRRTKFNASDAPAMLGESPHCTRTELLHRMATGLAPEPDAATQRRFDAGHQVEALLRKCAEAIIGEPLHPFVGVADFDDRYSASLDGCTFVGDEAAECKLLNARLRAAFADMETIAPEHRERSAAKCLPIDYRIQMEQQARIAGATRVLFLAGELREDGTLGDTLSCWYYPDDALWQRITSGWEQFAEDRAAYVPPTASAVEKLVAEPVEALPAVFVKVEGTLVVSENFGEFQRRLMHFLDHRLIREPKTDQDFVDLDAQIKEMKSAEEALQRAEAQMLAQIQTVDQAKKTKDMLAKLVRDNRLMAEKLLAGEKERRRGEIVAAGVKALADHIANLTKRLGRPYMPQVPADFAGAIRGKKSLASMEDAVSTELAQAKIAANEVADRIDANLKTMQRLAGGYTGMFPDAAGLVLKAADDFEATVTMRVAERERREQERLDAEREKIRAEEQAKAQREAEARAAEERRQQAAAAEAQRQEQEALERRQREEDAKVEGILESRRKANASGQGGEDAQHIRAALQAADAPAVPAVAANVHPLPTKAPVTPSGPPTLRLGQINERLAPLKIDDAGLTALGFPPAGTEGAAKLRRESDWHAICAALAQHVVAVANGQRVAA